METLPRRVLQGALLCLSIPALATPFSSFPPVDVFVSGTEGYHTYRIPALVAAADGSLIAFAEGRKENSGDPGSGDIDLVFKRSTDGGVTWSALQVLDDPGEGWAASNPTPVLDRTTGRISLLYNRWEPGYGTRLSRPGTRNSQGWLRFSDDHGRTWSPPRDLTPSARDLEDWGAIFFGPGGAIQTQSGRLLVPAAAKPGATYELLVEADPEKSVSPLRAFVLYSEDQGETWRRGELLTAFSNENQLVELADGRILMDARQNQGSHRWVAFSDDQGQTWSRPRAGHQIQPVATALEAYPQGGPGVERFLWTGPRGPGRTQLVMRVSRDGQTFPQEQLLYGGYAAYSDLAVFGERIGVLWERGIDRSYQFITFSRLL